eukprot:5431421-Amphidinium_carterae.1
MEFQDLRHPAIDEHLHVSSMNPFHSPMAAMTLVLSIPSTRQNESPVRVLPGCTIHYFMLKGDTIHFEVVRDCSAALLCRTPHPDHRNLGEPWGAL